MDPLRAPDPMRRFQRVSAFTIAPASATHRGSEAAASSIFSDIFIHDAPDRPSEVHHKTSDPRCRHAAFANQPHSLELKLAASPSHRNSVSVKPAAGQYSIAAAMATLNQACVFSYADGKSYHVAIASVRPVAEIWRVAAAEVLKRDMHGQIGQGL